ncbi:MAG: hypothetical protein MUF38_02720, partial [Anaerolineae bacterium]|nr:hypothetical protein [Anaerolineae bacterium]
LTSCYGLGCAGWLPRHIEPFLSPESSPHPIIPAPMHWTTFNRWMENFAWNADYTQIKIITLLNYGDPNQYRISILDAETQQFIRPVKDFFCANRCSYRWENDPYAPFTLAPGESVINKAATLQVTREEDEETYTIFDLQTGAVVSTWQSFGDNSFRWVGDTLFESYSYNKNICYRYWHPATIQNRFIEPLGCSFSNDSRYALLTSPSAMRRSLLIDTHSGETVEVNFYGEMGSFSMDGHSIALASKGFITFWDVENLMATSR